MSERYKLTSYTAGPIEHATSDEMTTWRDEVSVLLKCPELLIYDPVGQESAKVGKPSGKQVEYIRGLKKAGKYDLFYNELWKIWFGSISKNTDLVQLLTNLRMRKHIDGNHKHELSYWGDTEAVVRSDFILMYIPKNTKTVGTIWEQFIAMLFRIPIYLILPDDNKTEANSTMLFGVQISGGEIFYNVKDCCKFVIEKYSLNIIKQ